MQKTNKTKQIKKQQQLTNKKLKLMSYKFKIYNWHVPHELIMFPESDQHAQ